jgi:hypothetical protein
MLKIYQDIRPLESGCSLARRAKMDRKSGYLLVLGVRAGALFGAAQREGMPSIGLGASGGVFIGWSAAAYFEKGRERQC